MTTFRQSPYLAGDGRALQPLDHTEPSRRFRHIVCAAMVEVDLPGPQWTRHDVRGGDIWLTYALPPEVSGPDVVRWLRYLRRAIGLAEQVSGLSAVQWSCASPEDVAGL